MITTNEPMVSETSRNKIISDLNLATFKINTITKNISINGPLTIKPNLSNILLTSVSIKRKRQDALTSISVLKKRGVEVSLMISENGAFDLMVTGIAGSKFVLSEKQFSVLFSGLKAQDILSDFFDNVTSGNLIAYGGTVNGGTTATILV